MNSARILQYQKNRFFSLQLFGDFSFDLRLFIFCTLLVPNESNDSFTTTLKSSRILLFVLIPHAVKARRTRHFQKYVQGNVFLSPPAGKKTQKSVYLRSFNKYFYILGFRNFIFPFPLRACTQFCYLFIDRIRWKLLLLLFFSGIFLHKSTYTHEASCLSQHFPHILLRGKRGK